MAIVNGEPAALACRNVLDTDDPVLMSAGTLAEVLIVASGRHRLSEMNDLIDHLALTIVPVTEAAAKHAASAYQVWGKGFHPAGLNFGDCFAYALAMEQNCPLLYVGNDFSKTDVKSAIVARDDE